MYSTTLHYGFYVLYNDCWFSLVLVNTFLIFPLNFIPAAFLTGAHFTWPFSQREIRDRSHRPGLLPTHFDRSERFFTLPMTIDSHVQHPAFDNAVGIHCSKSPGITLFWHRRGLNPQPMPQQSWVLTTLPPRLHHVYHVCLIITLFLYLNVIITF